MATFANTYDIELTGRDGSPITVALRLNVLAQIKLKKKWNEGTTDTLFNAVDDIERFVDVMDAALKWMGNANTVLTGSDLVDLMAENDLLGMAEKQQIITSIGRVSGIFSAKEKAAIDKRAGSMFDDLLEDDEAEGNEKN